MRVVLAGTPVLKNVVLRIRLPPHRRSMSLGAATEENPRRRKGELRRPPPVDAEQKTQLGGVIEVSFGCDSTSGRRAKAFHQIWATVSTRSICTY